MTETPAPPPARHIPWDSLPWEEVTGSIRRRLVTGDAMMIAQVFLDKGAVVPKHSHMNEQITYIVSGALRFRLGEELDREVTVRAGEVLHIPAHLPHEATALEDTLDVDVFSPPRADWLDGTDAYFHAGAEPRVADPGAAEPQADGASEPVE
jgi:quercetin dioxygenase-like cupin family protein